MRELACLWELQRFPPGFQLQRQRRVLQNGPVQRRRPAPAASGSDSVFGLPGLSVGGDVELSTLSSLQAFKGLQ